MDEGEGGTLSGAPLAGGKVAISKAEYDVIVRQRAARNKRRKRARGRIESVFGLCLVS